MEAIIRIALTDDGGKWVPGTLLGAYPLDEAEKLGAGELGAFLCVRVSTGRYDMESLRAMRLRKVVDAGRFLSTESMQTRLLQKAEVLRTSALAGQEVSRESLGVKPRFDKVVDLDAEGRMQDGPEWQIPREEVIP